MAAAATAAPELHQLLDFLFAAKVEPTEAFAAAKQLVEAGVPDRAAIAALTPERLRQIVTNKRLHKKLCAALQRMPTLLPQGAAGGVERGDGSPSKRTKLSPHAPPPPPPPPDPSACRTAVLSVNRSPVMILWATVVACEQGLEWSEALSLASAIAARFAHAKGRRLDLVPSRELPPLPPNAARPHESPRLLGESAPAVRTEHGWRGLSARSAGDGYDEVHPTHVYRSLANAFGEPGFAAAHAAFRALAHAVGADALRADGGRRSYQLYTQFRPQIPDGKAGWGAKGELRLEQIERMRAAHAGEESKPRSQPPPSAAAAGPAMAARPAAPPPPPRAAHAMPPPGAGSEVKAGGDAPETAPCDATAVEGRIAGGIVAALSAAARDRVGGCTLDQLRAAAAAACAGAAPSGGGAGAPAAAPLKQEDAPSSRAYPPPDEGTFLRVLEGLQLDGVLYTMTSSQWPSGPGGTRYLPV